MPRTLTAKNVKTLPAPPSGSKTRQIDYWDEVEEGLGVRVSATHRGYVVRYRVDGRRRRLALDAVDRMSLAEARKRAGEIARAAKDGIDTSAEKQERREASTFPELATEYLERHAKKQKRSWKEDERIINAELLPHWTHVKVRELTRREIRRVIEAIADRPAPIMANRTLALVSKMLNFALRRDWIEANPAALIEKPGKETSRERTLTDVEVRELWAALSETSRTTEDGQRIARLNATMADAFKMRLLTAQRGGEVFRMRWADVDLTGGWWTVPAAFSKNKEAHRVPLPAAARDILTVRRSAAREDAAWVFENVRGSNIAARGKKAAAFLSRGDEHKQDRRTRTRKSTRVLPGLSFAFQGHDLRRTAASGMAAAGVPRDHISKVLNHVDGGPRATAVYDRHHYDREKRAALDAWARRLDAIINGSKAADVLPFQVAR
jgi:integrase